MVVRQLCHTTYSVSSADDDDDDDDEIMIMNFAKYTYNDNGHAAIVLRMSYSRRLTTSSLFKRDREYSQRNN